MTKINQAIARVLQTQFKKDCKEDFAIVKNAGYEIFKEDGHFVIGNEQTGRRIFIETSSWGRCRFCYNPFKNKKDVTNKLLTTFDFENCLKTPVNKEFYEIERKRNGWYGNTNKSTVWKNQLKNARWNVEFYTRRLSELQAELKKQIEKLNADIAYYERAKTEAIEKLATTKKELNIA